jgi:uncharacterized NAD(P)/FAD-binding protein YdhS
MNGNGLIHTPTGRLDVVLVGGGVAGTMTALKLAIMPGIGRITLLDREGRFGRGLAYSTTKPWHRTNIPSNKMGGIDDADPIGFTTWLSGQGHANGPEFDKAFVPRRLYGDYLCFQLDPHLASGAIAARHCEAVAIEKIGRYYRVKLSDNETIAAQIVVLCLGNHPPAAFPAIEPSRRLVPTVWASGALADIRESDTVLVTGTGATAVDAVLDLVHQGAGRQITMLSRRGMLPREEVASTPDSQPIDTNSAPTTRELFNALRKDVVAKAARGIPWQSVMDGFRHKASALWRSLPDQERARFVRHARTIWMNHRHRMAPDVSELLARLQAQQRLRIIAGRIIRASPTEAGYEVTLKPRGSDIIERKFDWILNCIGPEERYERIPDQLVTSLLRGGCARPGPLGLGLDVDPNCVLRDSRGREQPGLYLIGPATRGCFWEVTSVPAVRNQATTVVTHVSSGMRTSAS